MPKVRIAFDASPLLVQKTGVANYIEQLVLNLARLYPDTEFIGFYYNFLGRRSTVHLPVAPNIRYRSILFLPSKLVFQLRRIGIEIPLEFLIKQKVQFALYGNFLGYPSIYRTPSAPVIHDLTYLDLPEYVSAKNRSDLTRFVPREIARSSFVITVSHFSKSRIEKTYGISPGHILVTHIPPFPPHLVSESTRRRILREKGITVPFILFVGTIEPRKNIVNLIAAYKKLPARTREKYALVLAGRIGWNCQEEVEQLQAATAAGANIIHLGYVDDETKSALHQEATLFVSASHYEGFGMPVLESMSFGNPCAISDIPVFHEIAGSAAAYFDHANPTDIASVLDSLLADKKTLTRLRKESKKQANSYTWDSVAHAVYDSIAKTLE